jgi:tryptophan synthase alpha chain
MSSLETSIPQSTSRYPKLFERLQAEGRRAFIPFTLLGYPNQEVSFELIKALIDAGASALELGLAFSDPMADGPIIQKAATETLATGYTVDDAIALLKRIRAYAPDIPIGMLVYYNMVLARGIDQFFSDMADAGVDGVLIADLPPENMGEVAPAARQSGIDLIHIVSPLTTDERLKTIVQFAGGFLYIVSRLGITGVEERFDQQLEQLLRRIKAQTDLPLCVGFGISKPEHAEKMIRAGADGVITGSRVIQLIQDAPEAERLNQLSQFVREMLAPCQAECSV